MGTLIRIIFAVIIITVLVAAAWPFISSFGSWVTEKWRGTLPENAAKKNNTIPTSNEREGAEPAGKQKGKGPK